MGHIVYRKKILFTKNSNLTFKSTHQILLKEIKKLFIKNYSKIINKTYIVKKIKFKVTYHKSSELPESLKSWNVKISEFIKKIIFDFQI